jgi:predicted enzyme related to lactoylglutathione lyase
MAAAGGGSVRLTGGVEPVVTWRRGRLAMSMRSFACLNRQMGTSNARRVVHLELHTGNLPQASAFYARFLGCGFETVSLSGRSYLAMDLGGGIGGGIVECETKGPRWLPYVEVDDIGAVTAKAHQLGGAVLLEPPEGPAGWRSVVAEPAAGEIALWQPKATRRLRG